MDAWAIDCAGSPATTILPCSVGVASLEEAQSDRRIRRVWAALFIGLRSL